MNRKDDVEPSELSRWGLVKYTLEFPKCPYCGLEQAVPAFVDAVSVCDTCSKGYIISGIEIRRIFHTTKKEE